MPIYLMDKIKPKGGAKFPMVEAEDVLMPDGTRLDEAIFTGGGGLSRTAVNLLITVLSEAAYFSDQSANIQALKDALEKGAEDDPVIPDVPDIPDEPDSPVVYISTAALGIARLGYMRLTGTKGETPEEPDHSDLRDTTSALGIARLGCMRLTRTNAGEPDHSDLRDTTSALGVAKLGYTHLGDKY